jgi:deazaflavin-dependent oxidoreductase (nitroreductase family)
VPEGIVTLCIFHQVGTEPGCLSGPGSAAPESSLSEATRAALNNSQVIDLTTTGRRTGQMRRIEIFLHNDHGQLFTTGMPRADRTRDWIYNIEANANVVIHLKQSVLGDVPATARVVTDPSERRPLIEAAARRWGRTDVPDMLRHSPLIVLTVDHPSDHPIGS